MLISGPRQPVNDIDVLIELLMEEMAELWKGVDITDGSLKKKFTMKAIIIVTISDYPGLFSLSGQIKGKTACIVCIDGTCSCFLNGSKKTVYMRHRLLRSTVVSTIKLYVGFGVDDHLIRDLLRFIEMTCRKLERMMMYRLEDPLFHF